MKSSIIVDWYKETFLAFYTFLEPEVAKNLWSRDEIFSAKQEPSTLL